MTYANMLQLTDAVGPRIKIGAEIYGEREGQFSIVGPDGLTFAAVLFVLAASAFVAAWLPARRAAAVDPILALRSE